MVGRHPGNSDHALLRAADEEGLALSVMYNKRLRALLVTWKYSQFSTPEGEVRPSSAPTSQLNLSSLSVTTSVTNLRFATHCWITEPFAYLKYL